MARPSWQSPTAASTPGPRPGQGPAGASRLAPSPVRPWAQAGAHRVPPPGLLLLMALVDIPDAAAGGRPEEAGEPHDRVTETRTVTSRHRGGDPLTQGRGNISRKTWVLRQAKKFCGAHESAVTGHRGGVTGGDVVCLIQD